MYKARHLILLAVLSLGAVFVFQGDSFAACDGWFTFSSNCNTTIPVCSNGSCNLSGGLDAVSSAIGGTITNKPLSVFAQDIVKYFLSFISIIAVLFIIYAGFQVMIGGGDEEKVKKAKNTVTYVVVGIIIMWLSYSIVKWVLDLIATTTPGTTYNWMSLPEANAAPYTENELDTFNEYQNRLRVSIETIEGELRVDKQAKVSSLQSLKTTLQAAYDRLPDTGTAGSQNDTAKRSTDIDIDIAIKNPTSISDVGAALSKVSAFMSSAQITAITGDITATPEEGNAPMNVSFRANNIKDPSGANPDTQNYIWWMRGSGGRRIEIGRGPSLSYTFNQEGTFTVFLDVVSSSRNSKGKIDVLPLSVSKQIEVKPKLGEIILLINGVNVSNLSSLKLNPNIGKMGIILDASASRAVGNGTITETSWDFGNANTITYKGGPIVERQLYVNEGVYPVTLTIKTNTDQTFTKELQLIVRNPTAVIQTEQTLGHIGEVMNFSALSYFTNQANVEYSWAIQNEYNKKVLKSAVGPTLSHKFDTIGSYIVTLTSRNANGNVDTDSRLITIESQEPIVNLAAPTPMSSERPNTIVFDASKSYDPDTMSRKGLTFIWRLNGEKVTLDGNESDGSHGTMKFSNVGSNTISLTVSNAYGKVSTVEKTFEVLSTLAINMAITPSVAPIGTSISFIAQSEKAGFFEWNFGDGTAPVNGNTKVVHHTFEKTGVYTVNVTARAREGSTTNQTSRVVYVTDTNSPFASIDVRNDSNTVYEDTTACASGAFIANRSEPTNLDASKSINVDGSTSGLTYTWEYFGKIKTTPYISEKFSELGCFPVRLTVRNTANGATHSSTRYISLRNQNPDLTSLSTSIDVAKKDAQKILVKVTANGATDPDGVITSYIWYYKTESDKEPQNVQITQKNEITFVLPNITEKYYFGVILEDNDGGRKNSMDENTSEQTPLLIDNQNGNIYLPLISLSAPKTGLAGESMRMSVQAKTIVGNDITNKAEYAWDFDGDGKIDQRSSSPTIDYIYKTSGTYSLKVRVTNNGVSNTKYQTITIKNPLKAGLYGYKLQNGDIYLLNASKGSYDRVIWNVGGEVTESLYALRIAANKVPAGNILGKLTISSSDTDTNTVDIDMKDVRELSGSGVSYQSSPFAIDNTIHISGPGEKVLISLVGNSATRYVIDEDTSIDSDLDGVPDNDADNKDTPSYTDGSVYSFQDFSTTGNHSRNIKLSLFKENVLDHTETVTFIFDYIKDGSSVSGEGLVSLGAESLSAFDKKELDTLAELIRSTNDENRVVLMQEYNTLIENWDDPFSKAKTLLDIQERIDALGLTPEVHTSFTNCIDALLTGDASSTDDITIAAKLIESLIPESSPNRTVILEKLDMITSHPKLLTENKTLGKDILKLIEVDDTIENKYKLHIKNQLLIIVNGGQENVSSEVIAPVEPTSGGVLGFIGGVVKVFFIILGLILLVILFGYAYYRVIRKGSDIGFQDFLIDSVFHSKRSGGQTTSIKTDSGTIVVSEGFSSTPLVAEAPKNVDPLTSYTPPPTPSIAPLSAENDSGILVENTTQNSEPEVHTDPLTSAVALIQDTGGGEALSSISKGEEAHQGENESVAVPEWLRVAQSPIPEETIETVNETVAASEETASLLVPEASPLPSVMTGENIAPVDEIPQTLTPPHQLQEYDNETPEDVLLVKEENSSETPSEDTLVVSDAFEDAGTASIPFVSPPMIEEVDNNIAPPPLERDATMPDWLSLDPTPLAEQGGQVVSGEGIQDTGKKEDTLPEWLIQSVQTETTASEEVTEEPGSLLAMISDEPPKEKKKPKAKKPKSTKDDGGIVPPPEKSAPHDNIPEWLK